MKNSIDNLMQKKREAVSAAEKTLNGLIAGSFFQRSMNGTDRHCLSRMLNGKQRQLYIAQKHAEAVAGGVQQYEHLQKLLLEISELNIALIKQGVDLDDDKPN